MSHKLLPLMPLARGEYHPLSHVGAATSASASAFSPLSGHAPKLRSFTPFGVSGLTAISAQSCGKTPFGKLEATSMSQATDAMEDASIRSVPAAEAVAGTLPLEVAFSDLTIRETTRLVKPYGSHHRGGLLGTSSTGGEAMAMWYALSVDLVRKDGFSK